MEYNRRNFLRRSSRLAGLTAISTFINPSLAKSVEQALENSSHLTAQEVAKDETFWYQIRQAYNVSNTFINFNNGGVSPQPKVVQEALEYYNRSSNEIPTYNMWRILKRELVVIKSQLAEIAGCDSGEIVINRNATEALETIIFGLRLQKGDEVVLCKQDYPNMINAWKQREHRDGIILKWVDLKMPIENKNSIIRSYTDLFTNQTKIVHITHMINWNGQILPVKDIAQIAHQRNIEVLVDGAHSFAQFDYSIPDLECDYFGTSLHKWLCAPFGTGMMYVKKDKIKNLYPLLASEDPESDQIEKFEAIGTRSLGIEIAIGHAINFHQMIGIERKHQRLLYLKNYWIDRVKHHPKVHIHSPQNPEFGGAIALFSIQDKTPHEVHVLLHNKPRIHTVAINHTNIHGVRITPNVYTLIKEMDKLVKEILKIADSV